MKIIILGPQGSGKGTQAKLMSDEFGIPHISTGDIFRENIKNKTELGKTALMYINKGQLVPDDLTIALVKDRISKDDCRQGFILDGFPRNPEQAEALDGIVKIDKVIDIEISDDVAVKRISGRLTCDGCGTIYNKEYGKGLCEKCSGKLVTREDDTPEAVKERLGIYHSTTKPLIEHYKDIVLEFDGDAPIQEIFNKIIQNIKS